MVGTVTGLEHIFTNWPTEQIALLIFIGPVVVALYGRYAYGNWRYLWLISIPWVVAKLSFLWAMDVSRGGSSSGTVEPFPDATDKFLIGFVVAYVAAYSLVNWWHDRKLKKEVAGLIAEAEQEMAANKGGREI